MQFKQYILTENKKLKNFWHRYSYDVVKAFAFHTIFGIFGLTCVSFFETDIAKLGLSVVCIGFLMFLLYGEIWKLASADEAAGIDSPKLTGLYIGLFGSAVDVLLFIFKAIALAFPEGTEVLEGILVFVNFVYNGYMRGIMVIHVNETLRFGSTIWYFLLPAIPVIVACTLGYIFGRKNWHLTNIFIPETPEDREIKAEEKKKKKLGNEDDK